MLSSGGIVMEPFPMGMSLPVDHHPQSSWVARRLPVGPKIYPSPLTHPQAPDRAHVGTASAPALGSFAVLPGLTSVSLDTAPCSVKLKWVLIGVPSWCGRLRIWCCHCCGAALIPGWEYLHVLSRRGQKKKKKKKKTHKKLKKVIESVLLACWAILFVFLNYDVTM